MIRAGKRVEVVSIAPFESAPQQFVRWDVAGPGGREVGASAEAVVGACLGLGLHVAAAHAHGGRAYEAQGIGARATPIVMQTPDLGLPDLSPDAVPWRTAAQMAAADDIAEVSSASTCCR